MFSDPSPKLGDSDNILLRKIVQKWNTHCAASYPSEFGDSENDSWRKIVKSQAVCSAAVALTMMDSDHVLIRKLSVFLGDTFKWNDTEITLLIKVCRSASNLFAAGLNAPKLGDSKNDLLFKIAQSIFLT